MSDDKMLREQLAKIIDWNEAHADFHAAVDDFPAKLRGRVPDGLPHSAWQLLEHIRLALWDILEFSRDARHKSPKWPEGYWPKTKAPASAEAWDKSVKAIDQHLDAMRKLVSDPSRDLFAPLAARHRPDAAAASAAGWRPQCIPHRAVGTGAASAGCVARIVCPTRNSVLEPP